MTTSILAASVTTQAFTDTKDSTSVSLDAAAASYSVTSNGPPVVTSGPLKGTSYCGPRSYAITGPASCAALTLTYNAFPFYPILNLSTSNSALITSGTTCTVTVSIPGHPTVAAVTTNVFVVILECIITSFSNNTVNPVA